MRTNGHIACLRNQFKSINTFAKSYDYIIYWFGKYKPIIFFVLICKTLSPLHPRMMKEMKEMKMKILNLGNIFLLFCNYFPLVKGVVFYWKKTFISLTQGCFVPSLVEIGPVVLESYLNIFSLVHNYLPLTKGGDLHLSKLESNALCQFWFKLAQWFRRGNFLKFVNEFSLLSLHGTARGLSL